MGRTKGARAVSRRILPDDIDEMKRLRSLGLGLRDIGSRYGISRDSVRALIARPTPSPQKRQPPPVELATAPEPPAGVNSASEDTNISTPPGDPMASTTTQTTDTEVALLKREMEDLKGRLDRGAEDQHTLLEKLDAIDQKLQEVTRKPLAFERHGDEVSATCPNCSTTGTYQVPVKNPKSAEILESYFTQPHESGGNAFDCPNCGPQLRKYAEEAGFRLVKK